MNYFLNDRNEDIEYYVNNNNSVLYVYNKKINELERILASDWTSSTKPVCWYDKEGGLHSDNIDLKQVINDGNNFIKTVTPIASTVKKAGYFHHENVTTGITSHYLNEFLASVDFLEAIEDNKYKNNKCKNLLDLMKKETPAFYHLIKNLFHGERDEIILNFMAWLKATSFKDERQDILYAFIGTNEQNQGQGAGKGVLIDLLNKIFTGLTARVSNSTYQDRFNSNLINKKIVVFDELNFKGLKYDQLKDITGSSIMRVEYKGRDALIVKNVSSWLLFTNEHDTCYKIIFTDRRTNLIRPNPENESLKKFVIKKYFKDFKTFEDKLNSEFKNIIHLIALASDEVKSPNELITKAKIEYFKERANIEVDDIKNIHQIISNHMLNKEIVKILKENILLDCPKKLKLLISKILNYRLFEEVFTILQDCGFISKSEKPRKHWQNCKNYSLRNDAKLISIDMSKTKKFDKFRQKSVVIHQSATPKKSRELKQLLREVYGNKINLKEETIS